MIYINNIEAGEGTSFEYEYSEDCEVLIVLNKKEEITKLVNITVTEDEVDNSVYTLIGDSNIKWGKTSIYTVEQKKLGIIQTVSNLSYTIDNEDLAKLEVENNICYITANNKRKIGKITLTAIGEDFSIEKNINITSLW